MNTIQSFEAKLDRLSLEYRVATERVATETKTLTEAQSHVKSVEEAQKITQAVAEYVQTQAHRRVASIVTRCLMAVFGSEGPEFKIDFVRKRGKTEAELKLIKDGMELDPLDSSGGGVVDVCSFALRLAALVMTRPERRKLIVADEPFKHLSRNYSDRAREMLETLSEELGFQMIIVTHNPRLKTGKVIQL